MEIYLQNRQRLVKINLNNLKKTLKTLIETGFFKNLLKKNLYPFDVRGLELSIVFVSEKTIKQMNNKFRGINKATDVLSFAMFDSECDRNAQTNNILLGDVVVSPSKAVKQAQEYKIDYDDELLRLIIHGILHLLNYDHESGKKEAQRMQIVQKRLCDLANQLKAGEIVLSTNTSSTNESSAFKIYD